MIILQYNSPLPPSIHHRGAFQFLVYRILPAIYPRPKFFHKLISPWNAPSSSTALIYLNLLIKSFLNSSHHYGLLHHVFREALLILKKCTDSYYLRSPVYVFYRTYHGCDFTFNSVMIWLLSLCSSHYQSQNTVSFYHCFSSTTNLTYIYCSIKVK